MGLLAVCMLASSLPDGPSMTLLLNRCPANGGFQFKGDLAAAPSRASARRSDEFLLESRKNFGKGATVHLAGAEAALTSRLEGVDLA